LIGQAGHFGRAEHFVEVAPHEDHTVVVILGQPGQQERDDLDGLAAGVLKPAPVHVLLVEVLHALVLVIALGVVLAGPADAVGHDRNSGRGQHLHRHRRSRPRETGDDDDRLPVAEAAVELLHGRSV
jgi:hypothetical protein